MSDSNVYEDDTDEDQAPQQDSRDIKNLRRAAEEGKKAKREVAFLRAGIDPDDKRMAYFVKGYDGELDATAIRAAAVDAGFIQQEQAPDPAQQAAAQSQQRVAAASEGVIPQYDSQGGVAALEQAYAEGGVPAMLDVAKQYGVPVHGGVVGPSSSL
jgi:hypothetical protein